MKTFYRTWLKQSSVDDDFERTKVRLIIAFALMGIVMSVFYLIMHPLVQLNVPRLVYIKLPATLILSLSLLLVRVHHFWIAQAIVFSFWISFGVSAYYSGGITSLALPWLALVPVMANHVLSYRNSLVWFVIAFVTVIAFVFVHDQVPAIRYTEGPWRAAIAATGLTLVLFLFTSMFDRARSRLLHILRITNQELRNKQLDIEAQNEQIKTQIDFIEEKQRETLASKEEIRLVNLELHKKVQEIITRNEVLERHWNTLLHISKSKSINYGELNDALRDIVRVTAHSLSVSRVSIWTYDKETETISCKVCYSLLEDRYVDNTRIIKTDNPAYFEALKRERVINAYDARTYDGTRDFGVPYLDPLAIFSLMDAPFFMDGELSGVICCEQQNSARQWSNEDIIFATSMADIISLSYRSFQRREYERHIRQQSREITRMNETLEDHVHQRTITLEEQNRQLAEYADINSHKLRAPLSKIMGLISIIDSDLVQTDEKIITHLKSSCIELDEIVKKINEAIGQVGILTGKILVSRKLCTIFTF